MSVSNAAVFLYSEPPWSIAAAWMSSYLTLYLVAFHVAPRTIGFVVGLSGLLQVGGYPLMGWVTSHIGRKWLIQAGDFLGWMVALALWTVWPSPATVVIAYVLNQASAIIMPAWNSLFSEDLPAETVARGYMLLQIITVSGGVVIPFLAPWIQYTGVRHSGRLFLTIAFPWIAASWTARLFFLRESSVGEGERAQRREGLHPPWMERLRPSWTGPGRVLSLARIVAQVSLTLFATFAPLTFVMARGFDLSRGSIAYLPLAATGAGISLFLVNRRLTTLSTRTSLGLAILALGLAFFILLAAPARNLFLVLLAWGLIQGGQSLFWTSHTAYWMTWLPDSARVDVQGAVGAASALFVTVAGPLATPLLIAHPKSLDLAMMAATAGLGALWIALSRAQAAGRTRA